ncbi:hypothetical protein MKX03_011360 [Papaver bracteatum]|nr:hypothetical protein MKX03_011360 [Papaver bracteatum]
MLNQVCKVFLSVLCTYFHEKVVNPLFEKHRKKFGIGGALPPKKDLHRFLYFVLLFHCLTIYFGSHKYFQDIAEVT